MLKKIISLFLTAFILVGFCACGEAIVDNPHDTQATQDTSNKKPISTNNNNSDNNNSDNNNSNNNTNNNESDENKPSNNRINIGGDTPYKIIYENGYSSEASILLEYLKDIDKNSSYTMSSDTTLDDGSCEILIGLTNRAASMNAKSKLSSYLDFSILIDKNKIAIYANTAERIEAAIDYFVNSIALDSESQLAYTTVTSYVEAYTDYAYPNLSVANAPINKFSIILPYNATKDEKSVAIKLSNWIAENCGYMPSILLDKVAPANNEIIIGKTNRTESSSSDTENSNNVSYSATIKNGKVILYADTLENYDLAIKAFTDKIKASNGLLTKLNVKVLKQQEDNGENEEPTEPSLPDVPQNSTPDTPPKKAIFIGNSFIYWGGCVTYISNDSSNEAKREVGGDKGYFNEICKANGLNVDVYNYTYGGQNLDWIYENKLKSKSDSFLNSFDYVFISEAGQNQSSFKNTVKKVASLFKNAKEIVYLAHEYTFSQNATHIIGALDDLANDGFKIVAWGALVNDVYNGKVKVPNATLKYNKNTFIKNASSSEKMNANAAVISISGYGDSFHQNPLSGYITAQMCFSAISGKSAVGQRYDFCWDSSIAPQYDLQNFLTYQYGKNQTSNFIDVFNSKTDMLGLQILMDQYMDKYNKS